MYIYLVAVLFNTYLNKFYLHFIKAFHVKGRKYFEKQTKISWVQNATYKGQIYWTPEK